MKWRGGGFDNLRQHGKETGQGPRQSRARDYRSHSVGYKPELFEKCAHPGCGETRLHHERGPLVPDHPFVPPLAEKPE
jgi:hypothetical protein